MKTVKLKPEPLTQEGFSQFGEVVETKNHNFDVINDGFARKYDNLADIDTSADNGKTAVHIFIAKQRSFPLRIDMLEIHPFFSQCFIPRGSDAFLVVVAPPSVVPEIGKVRAFISNGDQGVNFSRGVWHFPLISIEDDAQFVVIDRLYDPEIDKIEQCNVYSLNEFNITLENS